MMRFKQELVASHGLVQGFDGFRRTFLFAADGILREAQIERERSFSEQRHLFFSETAPPAANRSFTTS